MNNPEKASKPRKDPLLSICVPTYNRPSLLKRTLESLQAEEHSDIEVIVTDNSDNDDSQTCVEEFFQAAAHPWRYHKNAPGLDAHENMNVGIGLARGEYVYIVHDDDYLLPGGLTQILQRLRDNAPQYKVLMFGVKVVSMGQLTLKRQSFKREAYLTPETALEKLFSNSSFARQPSIVVHKEAYSKVGLWDPTKSPPGDIDMWMRLFGEFGVYTFPEVVAAYTVHTGALTMLSVSENSAFHIGAFENIFDIARQRNLLPENVLIRSRASFFHQFILACTFRCLVIGEIRTARKMMRLFYLPTISQLPPPLKWLPLKLLFKFLLLV